MPLPVAWSDGSVAETEMTHFRLSAAPVASKPQAWLPQPPHAASPDSSVDAEWIGRSLPAAPTIIAVSPASPPCSHPPSVQLSAPSPAPMPASAAAPAAAPALAPAGAAVARSALRSVSFRQPAARRSSRPPSAHLSAAAAQSLDQPGRDAHSARQPQPAAPPSQPACPPSVSPPSSFAYCDSVDGYTVIDIRSLPASLSSSPAHSPLSSPAPPRRVRTLQVDTAQLMQAAAEEDVSPRTALFLAMRHKAKQDKKQARRAKEKSDRDRDRDRDRPSNGAAGSGSRQSQQPQPQPEQPQPQRQTPQGAAVGSKRHTLQPHSSSSVSSSLQSLSLSAELSSLSASMSASPRSSLSRGSLDEGRRDERRLKKEERRRLGYKLCKVSGCMEARGRDDDGQRYKYCKAHLGIHTLNNPNSRKKTQREAN